jgi:predicted transposase YbfD/YdcC
VEMRALRVHCVEPDAVGFSGARSIVVVRSTVDIKKSGKSSIDTRYYLTSIEAQERGAEAWQALIRGHWAGVEIRNHWRRDALMGEDRSRTRKPKALANLAILRSTLFAVLAQPCEQTSLSEIMEKLHSDPVACLSVLRRF